MEKFITYCLIIGQVASAFPVAASEKERITEPERIASSVSIGIASGLVVPSDYNSMLLKSYAHGRGQYTAMKGAVGEGIMNDFYTANRQWSRLDAAKVSRVNGKLVLQRLGGNGQTGLDGIYIRNDTKGNPTRVMVAEAKAYSSKLRKDRVSGRAQFDARYRSDRLALTAQRYGEATMQIRQGRVQQLGRVPDGVKGVSEIRLSSNRSALLWYDAASKNWCYVSTGSVSPDELATSLSKLNRLLLGAADGTISYKARVFRFNINDSDVVTMRSINYETGDEVMIQRRYGALTTHQRVMIKQNLVNAISDDLQAKGVSALTAKERAARLFEQAEKRGKIGQLAKQYRPQQRYTPSIGLKSAFTGAGAATVLAAVFEGASQMVNPNGFDAYRLATASVLGGTSGFFGTYSGAQVQYLLTAKPAQQLFNRVAVATTGKIMSGGTSAMTSQLGGAIMGGTIASAVLSYGMYFCDMTDLKTANRGMIAGTSGAVVGSGTMAGATILVAAYGTASTGAAISSLSGAAATSATTAWFGGGAVAAGGGGVALGSVVLTGGAIIIAVAVAGGVTYAFYILDEQTRRDVVEGVADASAQHYIELL